MSTTDLVGTFLRPLNRVGVRYMVTGSVASSIYGEPRFTQDLDLVLALSAVEAGVLAAAFPPIDFYCAPAEVIAEEFNIYHHESGWRADCYMVGRRDMIDTNLIAAWAERLGVAPQWRDVEARVGRSA